MVRTLRSASVSEYASRPPRRPSCVRSGVRYRRPPATRRTRRWGIAGHRHRARDHRDSPPRCPGASETRADDRTSVAAMEDRKREGYFDDYAPAARITTAGSVDDGKSNQTAPPYINRQLATRPLPRRSMTPRVLPISRRCPTPAGRARAGHHDRRRSPVLLSTDTRSYISG